MNETGPTPSRWLSWLPTVGLVLWAGGAAAIWAIGRSLKLEPGELVLLGSVWLLVLGIAAHDFVRGMFGPVFTYEITRLGRKKSTITLRLLYILGISTILLLMYWSWLTELTYYSGRSLDKVPANRQAEFGLNFFGIYMTLQALVVAFLTPAYLAGCIADEKERKTLEFLLATDLRNHEIIFGKTAARVAFLLMFILAGLPIVAFLQLFGGIEPNLLLAGTAATVILVLGLSGVSIAFSTAYKRPRNAIALTFLVILAYLVSSGLLALFLEVYNAAPPIYKTLLILGTSIDCSDLVDWLAWLAKLFASGNPVYVVLMLMFPFMRGGTPFAPDAVGDALFAFAAFWGVIGGLCLSFAVTRLRTTALQQAYGEVGRSRMKKAKSPQQVTAETVPGVLPAVPQPAPLPEPLSEHPPIGNDPIFWREVFVEGSGRRGILGIVVTIVILVLAFLWPVIAALFLFADAIPVLNTLLGLTPQSTSLESRWEDFRTQLIWWTKISTGTLTTLAMMAATVRGAGTVSGEHDRDTWISLISAPLTSWEIIRGKWLGCILGLRKLYIVLLLIWGTSLALGGLHPVMIIPTVLTCGVLISAFSWIGIFSSITSRNTLIATIRALLIALFFLGGFWLLLLFCCILPANLLLGFNATRELDLWSQLGFQLLAGTPPYMVGWMPMQEFSNDELGPFEPGDKDSFGPASMVIAFLFWSSFNVVLGSVSWMIFSKQSNR